MKADIEIFIKDSRVRKHTREIEELEDQLKELLEEFELSGDIESHITGNSLSV